MVGFNVCKFRWRDGKVRLKQPLMYVTIRAIYKTIYMCERVSIGF